MTYRSWISREFPVLRDRVVLDNASAAPLPLSVTRAMSTHLRLWSEKPQSQIHLDALIERARVRAAALMRVAPDNISYVPSVTAGVLFVAYGLPLECTEVVLVPEEEYPATLLPWLDREREGGARVKRPRATESDLEAAIESPDVRVLCLSAVGWLGHRYNVERIARACRSFGVILVLDTSQSCGLYDFEIDTGSAFVCVTSFSKWAFAPEGIACLSVSTDVIAKLTPVLTGVDACAFDADRAAECELPATNRMPLNLYNVSPVLAAGLEAALEWGSRFDRAETRAWVERLVAEAESRIAGAGFVVASRAPDHRSGILLFTAPDRQSNPLVVAALREKNIYVQHRAGWIRASFHLYNRLRDVRLLASALAEISQ